MSEDKQQRGFTLVEIAVAIAILALAMSTLLTLNTSQLDQAYRERNLTKAALYAKYIMTFTEVHVEAPDLGSEDGTVEDFIQEHMGDEASLGKDLKKELEGWRWEREVTSIDLPEIEDAMRRVDLTVSWGELSSESYQLVYFMTPTAQQRAAAAEEGGE